MRKLLITLLLAVFASSSFAQKYGTDPNDKVNFGFDVFYDIWQNMPDSMRTNGLSLGNSIYVMYEQKIWTKDGRFRVGLGAGITTHKLSSNRYIENIHHLPIEFKPFSKDIEYTKSKLVVNYLDLIAELRYKSPSNFRLALGAKVGFRLDSHTTYKGEQLGNTGIIETVKYKDVQYIEKIIFGPTLKVGYGFMNLNFYYSLTKLFAEGAGPEIYPISVGITFNPF